MGALAAGAVLGFTSPTGEEIQHGAFGFNVSQTDFNWLSALTPLGAMIMCVPVGFIMDMIGRKTTMLSVILIFTVGWALIIWSNGVEMLMVGRFLTGMAGGTFCIAAPLYTSEIAEKHVRGSLGSYFQLMITVGILFVYVIGNFCGPQIVAIACGVIPFVFGLAFIFMPESPTYELIKGNHEKASKNLQWLRGSQYNIDNEMKDLQDEIDEHKRNPVSFSDSWQKKSTKKAFLICFGLMFFQQFSGINAVIFFTSDIFKDAGIPPEQISPKEASIIVGVMQVVATYASTLIVDRLGRKILLLLSVGVMALCHFLLGLFFTLKAHVMNDEEIKDIGWLPVLALSVFMIAFSIGFGPIPWMITAEVFPREVKSVASSAAGTFNWFLAFLVTMFFHDILDALGNEATFYMFMGICIIGFIFVFLIVLETKGKSFREIQQELGSDSPRVSSNATINNGIVNEGFE